jgi:hypothetical protein
MELGVAHFRQRGNFLISLPNRLAGLGFIVGRLDLVMKPVVSCLGSQLEMTEVQ